MPVSIRDIAEKCGQPVYVVGRVLNDYLEISQEVRKQVFDAAKALGYPLNEENLAGRRTYNIGVLVVDEGYNGLTHPYFASMLNAFKDEVERHGYDVTFINHNIGTDSAPRWYYYDATRLAAKHKTGSGCLFTEAQLEHYNKNIKRGFLTFDHTGYPAACETVINENYSW